MTSRSADRVGDVAMPMLVVGVVHYAVFPPDIVREAVAAPVRAPGSRYSTPGTIAIEVPQQLAAVIEGFLAGPKQRPIRSKRRSSHERRAVEWSPYPDGGNIRGNM